MNGEFWPSRYNKESELHYFFISMNRPFTVKKTAYSTMIDNGRRKVYLSSGRLWMKHLGLITQLKAYVRKTVKNVRKFSNVKVYDYNDTKFGKVEGKIPFLFEYDLTSAYISGAQKMQYISPELAEKILKQKKQFRLKILGSLGTKKNVIEYDKDGNMISSQFECDTFLSSVWKSIVGSVNTDLRDQCRNDELWTMYWVDNYWTNSNDTGRILFNTQGYKFRVQETDLLYRKTAGRISMYFPDQRFLTMPLKQIDLSSKVEYDNFLHTPEELPANFHETKFDNGKFYT